MPYSTWFSVEQMEDTPLYCCTRDSTFGTNPNIKSVTGVGSKLHFHFQVVYTVGKVKCITIIFKSATRAIYMYIVTVEKYLISFIHPSINSSSVTMLLG